MGEFNTQDVSGKTTRGWTKSLREMKIRTNAHAHALLEQPAVDRTLYITKCG